MLCLLFQPDEFSHKTETVNCLSVSFKSRRKKSIQSVSSSWSLMSCYVCDDPPDGDTDSQRIWGETWGLNKSSWLEKRGGASENEGEKQSRVGDCDVSMFLLCNCLNVLFLCSGWWVMFPFGVTVERERKSSPSLPERPVWQLLINCSLVCWLLPAVPLPSQSGEWNQWEESRQQTALHQQLSERSCSF